MPNGLNTQALRQRHRRHAAHDVQQARLRRHRRRRGAQGSRPHSQLEVRVTACNYRVDHLLRERNMLTPNLKLRLAVSFPSDPGHQRNLESYVNIILSRSSWATLWLSQNLSSCLIYRVAHLLWERNMLTSKSKFRCWPGPEDKLKAKRNFKFGVNISISRSRWATL